MRSRRNIEWWRSNIHSPARWPMARIRSSASSLSMRAVVGQLVAASRCRSPSRRRRCTSPGTGCRTWPPDRGPGAGRSPHEELEEGIAAASDGEERGQNGHGHRRPRATGGPVELLSHARRRRGIGSAGRLAAESRRDDVSSGGASADASARSPTVGRAPARKGRRRDRRSADTRRSRKMTVWPTNSSSSRVTMSIAVVSQAGQLLMTP